MNDDMDYRPLYQHRPLATVILTLLGILLAAIILSVFLKPDRPAHANDVIAYPTNPAGWSVCQGGVCEWGNGALPNPNIRAVPQPESQADKDAADAREREWVQRCNPTITFDHFGVRRYIYNHDGCEFGK